MKPTISTPEPSRVSSKSFVIGIDTGGTYTDAVVIERNSQRILSSAKSITTKGDLSVGVGLAMQAAVAELKGQAKPQDIKLVSISTTLATNAVVEGHGGSVAVILIGFDDKMVKRTGIAVAFADMPVIRISGGHDHNGELATPLDTPALKAALEGLQGRVTAIAIASTSPQLYEKRVYPASAIRPWLQAFDYPVPYTPAMVQAQIQATNDSGITSYLMWDAGNKYRSLREVLTTD